MKPRFKSRELFWMSLPALALGGTAWWLGSGGQMGAPLSNLKKRAFDVRRPSLSLEKVMMSWVSPAQDAASEKTSGCYVSTSVAASASWNQIRPAEVPHMPTTTVLDDKGRSLNTILVGSQRAANPIPITFSTGTSWGTSHTQNVPDTTYDIGSEIGFRYMPASTRSATLYGTVTWGTATPVQIKAEILPPWMRRPASRLHLINVKWKSASHGGGGQIEVVAHLTNPQKPCVFGNGASAATSPLSMGIGYDPNDEFLATPPGSDVILAEWSQRVESGDGKINSLVLLKNYLSKTIYAYGLPPILSANHRKILDKFAPLAKFPEVAIEGGTIGLTYNVNAVPAAYKNPVFCCDIFIVGDGKISIRCPLIKPSP